MKVEDEDNVLLPVLTKGSKKIKSFLCDCCFKCPPSCPPPLHLHPGHWSVDLEYHLCCDVGCY